MLTHCRLCRSMSPFAACRVCITIASPTPSVLSQDTLGKALFSSVYGSLRRRAELPAEEHYKVDAELDKVVETKSRPLIRYVQQLICLEDLLEEQLRLSSGPIKSPPK